MSARIGITRTRPHQRTAADAPAAASAQAGHCTPALRNSWSATIAAAFCASPTGPVTQLT